MNYYMILMTEKGLQYPIYVNWFGQSTFTPPPAVQSLDINSMESLYITMSVITAISIVFFIVHKLTGVEQSRLLWGQTEEEAEQSWYNKTIFGDSKKVGSSENS